MHALSDPTATLDFLVPAKPVQRPIEQVLLGSAEIFGLIYEHQRDRTDPEQISSAIGRAETFMAAVEQVADVLRDAAMPEDPDEIRLRLKAFVMAWPNASGADLAAYGLQLVDDVEEREPCRYALRAGLRHLRQTSRFLPSIAEVLAALDEAQARIRNTAFHVNRIPAEIETARADLAAARAKGTAHRPRRSDQEHDQP